MDSIGKRMGQILKPVVTNYSPPPSLVFEPIQGWVPLKLGNLWTYRELLYFLVWRDIKVRYEQTILGVGWVVLQPILMTLIFTIFFGVLGRLSTDGLPHAVFYLSGLVLWTYFSSVLSQTSSSLVSNANFLNKVYFPRLLLPLAVLLSRLVDFVVNFFVLLGLMFIYGVYPTIASLWTLLFLLLAMIIAWGLGLWFSALNVRYRDVNHIIPFLTRAWLFATPVIYSSRFIPEKWHNLYSLNPMVGVMEGFRWALLGTPPPTGVSFAISAVAAIGLLVSGMYYFRRMEWSFADFV